MHIFWYVLVLVELIFNIEAKWVRDVDSKIIDEIKENPSIAYLIQFHAPWLVEIFTGICGVITFPKDPGLSINRQDFCNQSLIVC